MVEPAFRKYNPIQLSTFESSVSCILKDSKNDRSQDVVVRVGTSTSDYLIWSHTLRMIAYLFLLPLHDPLAAFIRGAELRLRLRELEFCFSFGGYRVLVFILVIMSCCT